MYERLAGIAHAKGVEESAGQVFWRAVGCNWLVCLAVCQGSRRTPVSPFDSAHRS